MAVPGGRLTPQERQQIAIGVADSLPYAEIARRLERPTSTITREVMRNGGPTAYRADLAHRAAEHRSHRRRPASLGAQPVAPPHGRNAEVVAEYEERLTTVLMASGLSKMAARVLTCLYTTDADSLTASRLAQHLQVSPASISKAITFLEAQSLVRRERDERRHDRYLVDNELFYQATIAGARSNDQLVETARQGAAILGPHSPAATRLENIARSLDFISESIIRAAEQVLEVLHTEPETPAHDTRTTGPIRLRPAEVGDLPFVYRQELEYIETIEPDAREVWLAALDRNLALWIDCLPRTLFCVDADGLPLGFAMWIVAGDTATLVSIQVLGSRRRQGLGRLLLDAFEQRVGASGARSVKLGVHRSNPAQLLYQGAGYETTGHDGEYVLLSKSIGKF